MNSLAQLLQDELRARQNRNPNFSLRAFARWLGISPAQLSQLISGKRPVTLKMATKISDKLNLSPVERIEFLKKSVSSWVGESPSRSTVLSEDRFHLIADWYHFAILSLTKIPGAQPDPRWIATRLGISVTEAREASDRMVRMGLLELKPVFRQIGDPLSVSSDVPSAAIRKFHKQTLALATEKVDTVGTDRRDIRSITMSVNTKKLPLAKKMLDETLDKVCALLETGSPSEVYTLAFQLFPLTQTNPTGEIES